MLHNEIRELAARIGNELQDAADQAGITADACEAPEKYETLEAWREVIEGECDELVSTLDLLAAKCAEARDALDAAKRGVPA